MEAIAPTNYNIGNAIPAVSFANAPHKPHTGKAIALKPQHPKAIALHNLHTRKAIPYVKH
ncbi:hypothetical protein [Sphaerospermopsis sp. FACHB-1094]|uniref:hypothetical protein n=1 Tax=Sphaerospermopsis sp. FACHB-1094 TaxID=2692861 RepID=UPI001A7E8290|nr:hypothetical protein [Sphaerospermopsis sp. FACHB-1094]